MSEGYLAVATGDRKYFALAATLAKSIRFFDRERAICLACDSEEHLSAEDLKAFDSVIRLPGVGKLRGTEYHLYVNHVSPFERTLYVDSDCLIANETIHACWEGLKDYSVTFCGIRRAEGVWRRGVDVGRLRRLFGLDHIVKLSGGVFYFDNSEASFEFFSIAQDLFEKRREEISVPHGSGGGYANEPIWGVAMALTRKDPFRMPELNISTTGVERWEIMPDPHIRLWKGGRMWEPAICHFLGLGGGKCPNDLYNAFAEIVAAKTVGDSRSPVA